MPSVENELQCTQRVRLLAAKALSNRRPAYLTRIQGARNQEWAVMPVLIQTSPEGSRPGAAGGHQLRLHTDLRTSMGRL